MAEAFVQLPTDSTGKKIRAIEKVVGANTVYMEGDVPYDGDGNLLWAVGGDGYDALLATIGLAGEHTNPRRYEKDKGFASNPIARAGGLATPLWAAALAAVYPAAGRTAGLISTIYELHIENSTGAAVTAWLEVAGNAITVPVHVANNDTVVIDWPAGFNVGNVDIDLNASVNDVVGQIFGTQE